MKNLELHLIEGGREYPEWSIETGHMREFRGDIVVKAFECRERLYDSSVEFCIGGTRQAYHYIEIEGDEITVGEWARFFDEHAAYLDGAFEMSALLELLQDEFGDEYFVKVDASYNGDWAICYTMERITGRGSRPLGLALL